MSRRASLVPEAPPRTRRETARVAQEVADAVDRACAASGAVCDLLSAGSASAPAEAWETALQTVVVALGEVDALATLLRGERDALILSLSSADPTGRPWRSQAYIARLTGIADSLVNRIVKGHQ